MTNDQKLIISDLRKSIKVISIQVKELERMNLDPDLQYLDESRRIFKRFRNWFGLLT